MNLARSLGRHAFLYAAGVLSQRVVGFLMLPLYTRALSTAEYGQVGVVDATVGLVALVVGLNLSEALVRIYHDETTDEGRRRAVSTTLLASALLAGAAALLLGAASGPLSTAVFGGAVPPRLFAIALATMAFDAVAAPCFAYLRILLYSGTFVAISLGRLVLAVGLNLVFLGWLEGGVQAYFAAGAIASGVQAGVLAAWTLRRAPPAVSRDVLGRLLRFSLPLVPASVFMLVLHQSARWTLARDGALEALGILGVAWTLGSVVTNGVVQPFQLVWSAKVYEVLREPGGAKTVARVFLWFTVVVVWCAVGLSLLTPLLFEIEYLSEEFGRVRRVVPVVAFGYVFFALGYLVHVGVYVAKRTDRSLIAAAVAAVAGVALNVAAARLAPAELVDVAAAAATGLAFLVLLVLRYRFAQELHPIPYAWGRAAAIVGLGIAFVAMPAEALSLRLAMAVGFPLGALGLLPPEDRSLVTGHSSFRIGGAEERSRDQ